MDGIALGGSQAIELLGDAASAFRSRESGGQFWGRLSTPTWGEHARKEIPFSVATKRVLSWRPPTVVANACATAPPAPAHVCR